MYQHGMKTRQRFHSPHDLPREHHFVFSFARGHGFVNKDLSNSILYGNALQVRY